MLFAQDSILCVGVYVSENKGSITLLLQLMVPVCVCVHTEQLQVIIQVLWLQNTQHLQDWDTSDSPCISWRRAAVF